MELFTFVTDFSPKSRFTMINNEKFIIRLQKVIDFYGESASSFAEKIGVQRSSISHILSGRNKPSLDFVLKVLSAYPEVELYWLLNGKGIFPAEKTSVKESPETSTDSKTVENENQILSSSSIKENKEIDRIVIFYKDGTFKDFEKS